MTSYGNQAYEDGEVFLQGLTDPNYIELVNKKPYGHPDAAELLYYHTKDGTYVQNVQIDEGVKENFAKLKQALSIETGETKEMMDVYRRALKNQASSGEIDTANKQFKDLLKLLGITTFVAGTSMIPGTGPALFPIEKYLNTKGVSILPNGFKDAFPQALPKSLHKVGDKVTLDGATYDVLKVDVNTGTVDVKDQSGRVYPKVKSTTFFKEDVTTNNQYPEITQSKKEEIVSAWEYQEDLIDIGNGYQILSGENHGYADNVALLIGPDYKIKDNHTDIGKLLDNNFGIIQEEDVVDGNFPTQQRDREMQQGIERELKMYKILERLAQMWWNNDMSPAVEQKLADMGWEVGEDEGSDTPSVFVIEIGDENGNSYISWPIEQLENDVVENFADGKKKGKSRPGRVKKSGASCKGSVTSLRAKAKKYSGEKGKMYHWCANMKGGKKKS
jgi:hypothetical protein